MKRSRAKWMKQALAPLKHDAMVRLRQEEAQRVGQALKEREAAAAAARAAREERKPSPAPRPEPKVVDQEPAELEGLSAWEQASAATPAQAPRKAPPAPARQTEAVEDRPVTAPRDGKYQRVNPKKAINRLASHIVQAQADVRVKGERQKKEVHEIRVPVPLVKQHLYDDEIEYLEKQGTLTHKGKYYRVNQEGLKFLDDQWYRYFTKRLPVVTNKQRYNRRDSEAALREQVAKLIGDEVQVNVRVNGGTGEIERLDFSAWALDTDLRTKHQVGWGAHNLLRIQDGQAVIRAAGAKLLTEEQVAYFLDLKRQQQTAPDEAATAAAPSEPPKADTAHPAPAAAKARPREERKPQAAPAKPAPAEHKEPRAPTPQAKPRKPAPEAKARKPAAEAKAPSHGGAPQKPERKGPGPAKPQADARPQGKEAPAAMPRFEYLLDASRGMHVVSLANPEDLARLREWADQNQSQIHGWPRTQAPKQPLGALDGRVLLVSQRFMPTHGAPRLVPGGVQRERGIDVAGTVYNDVFQIKASVLNASTEWTTWSEAHGERIPGHPRYEGSDALSGVAYKQQMLSVAQAEAEALFGQAFPDKVMTTTTRTPMVRFLFPDD